MFVDYVTLLLINTSAALAILAVYLLLGMNSSDQARWAPAFAMPGLIAFVNGIHMVWVWPLPAVYNIAYGEMSVLLGVLLLGAAWSLALGWDLMPVAVYALVAGVGSVVTGARFVHAGLSSAPMLAAAGFILTGLAGICAIPMLLLKEKRALRVAAAAILLVASVIWLFTWAVAYWTHLDSFGKWMPLIFQ